MTVNVLIVGTGEYTTGFIVGVGASKSDKPKGVAGLVVFDLRRRGFVSRILMAGTDGTKFPSIRAHLKENIAECYADMDTTLETFPADNVSGDSCAYVTAMNSMNAGDLVVVFTPDHTHFDIAMAAIDRGLHVLLTKPAVMTAAAHERLITASNAKNVLVQIEVHKRWDPIYADACSRIRSMAGSMQFFHSYMSQPKHQLTTFAKWAGKSSDISYYLNSHHIDFHCWAMLGRARPVRVMATGSRSGVAESAGCPSNAEDTITVVTEWETDKGVGTAVYVASWAAPNGSEVHTQQRCMYLGSLAEVRIDQAHRGYNWCTDGKFSELNPLYMRYTPDSAGRFAGQQGYGYQSIESFVTGAIKLNEGQATLHQLVAEAERPTIQCTLAVTQILNAARLSLDAKSEWIDLRKPLPSMMKFGDGI